jgi:hypothetical protein
MEYENVIIAINKLKTINDYANSGLIEPIEEIIEIIEIANSFGCIYIKENFESIQLYYQNINKLKSEIISIIVRNINSLDNTKFIYWKIYRDLKLYFPSVEVNIPNLTEEEKINNVTYIKQLKMTEENKKLTQKSYDAGYKICSLYLCYYIEDKTKRLESCEKILNELINENDILEVKRYISKLKKIYKL